MLKYCLFKVACKSGTLFSKRKDVIRRAPTSFVKFIDHLKRFIQLDPTVFDLSRTDEGTGIRQTMTSNNAFYHKSCYNNFNDSL